MAAALRKWKREREQDGNGLTEPSPKRERESSPVAPSAAKNDQVIDEQAVNQETGEKYVKAVEAAFKDDAGSYQKFFELLNDVRLKRVDHAGVVRRVKELFKDHRSLVVGFNMFLPENEKITLPSTKPPKPSEVSVKQRGIGGRGKVEAQENNKQKKLFAENRDMLTDFRTFLPTSEDKDPHQPDQQAARAPMKVKFVHPRADVRESEAPGKSSRSAEMAVEGKEKIVETTNSRKLKERTSKREEEARTKPTEVRQPARMSTHNATERPQVQSAPRNAAAAGSQHPASDQRVNTRTTARRQLPGTNTPQAPPTPLPSIAELGERLKKVTMCHPDCKACEPVEYPTFDWHAEDPEYHAKGKANRERERQALIARGVPGSFNDT